MRPLRRFEARWYRFWGRCGPGFARCGLALFFLAEAMGVRGPQAFIHNSPVDAAAKALSILSVGRITTGGAPYALFVLDLLAAALLVGLPASWVAAGIVFVRAFLAISPLVMLRDELFAAFPLRPNSHGWGVMAVALLCCLALLLVAQARWQRLEASAETQGLLFETPDHAAHRVRKWQRFSAVFAPCFVVVALCWPHFWPRYLVWFHARQENAALSEKLSGRLLKKSMPPSIILGGRKITTWVYLPPGYDTSTDRYPVVYVLHGMPGGVRDCFVKGRVQDAAEELIQSHQIKPLIVVGWDAAGPAGPGDVTNYLDRTDYRMESFITDELVPYVDRTYRTIPQPEYRALDGISAGGYAAPNLIFKHPDLWKIGASHTGFFSPEDDVENMNDIMGQRRLNPALWDANDPTKTVMKFGARDDLHLYLDIGEGDDLLPEFGRFAKELKLRGIEHEAHVFGGRHTWEYWSTHFFDSLRYEDRYFGK